LLSNIIISLDTEFIENDSRNVTKNDCEINAAKRLLERLGEDYPRLPICLQGDVLYAAESIMKTGKEHDWKYIFTQKETCQKALSESYEWIQKGGGANIVDKMGKEGGKGESINHVEEVAEKKKLRIGISIGMKKKKMKKEQFMSSNG